MTAAPGPAEPSFTSSDAIPTESQAGVPTEHSSTDPKSPKSQRWISSLPKRIRIRTKPKKDPDRQLAQFLGLRTRVSNDDALETLRTQFAGHWHDIEVEQDSIDSDQLNSQLSSMTDQSQTQATESDLNWNWRRDWVGLAISLLFHFAVLALLIIWALPEKSGDGPLSFVGQRDGIDLSKLTADNSLTADLEPLEATAKINQDIPLPFQPLVSKVATRPTPVVTSTDLPSNLTMTPALSPEGGGITGRAANQRADLVSKMGGNEGSEIAVDRGLRWIAAHQREDGGWQFSHDCDCGNPGYCHSRTAATGLALLTFLARNHNHVDKSEYQEVVLKGLNFLILASDKGDLTERTQFGMYGQGMATLAMAEAYAISKDDALKTPTQQAVDFIAEVQHPAGGWRYTPHEIGDLNVTGWQLMALKTAKLAGLKVPEETLVNAKHFVDSQAISNGSRFTYPGLDPDTGQPVPTAIGILLRMYEGWGPGRDEIQEGVSYLAGKNISANHIYFNYYTTMVMFHFGGDRWKNWNRQMRDFLINSQDVFGHENGSWYFPHEKTGAEGGRLFNTAMAVLILEVYYRHLKLYDDQALVRDFPLD